MSASSSFARYALSALLFSVAAGAGAAPGQLDLDAQARDALKSGQFQLAIAVTREITKNDPASTLNWYRMAIAAEKERDFALAARAIQAAEKLDPSLSFASSPDRVYTLKASIAAGSAAIDDPKGATPDGAHVPGAVLATVAEVSQPREARIQVAGAPAQIGTNPPLPVEALAKGKLAEPGWLVPAIAYSALFLAVLVVLLLGLAKYTKQWLHMRRVNAATMPLDDLIVHCRDHLGLLQQRLEYHGHKDTELFTVVERLQPSFARECGRNRLRLENLKDNRPLADVKSELATRVPKLGTVSAAEMHADAVQQALQKRRLA